MSSSGLTLLLAVSFTLFAGVTSNFPYWAAQEFRFHCVPVCWGYLKGETYSCFSASGFGMGAGRLIIRILPDFDWRYYGIHEAQYTDEFCRHVLVADEFYLQGNGTLCNPLYVRRSDTKVRSSGDKTNTEVLRMEKLTDYLDNVTSLAKEIQKEVLVVDEDSLESANTKNESSDARTKRCIGTCIPPSLAALAKNLLGLKDTLSPSHSSDIKNINQVNVAAFSNSYKDGLRSDKRGTARVRSHYSQTQPMGNHHSAVFDPRSDALCYWASKKMCQSGRMVVCFHDICCWATLATDRCGPVANENGIGIHRQSIYHIIQAAKLVK